jgi:PAS domain S-box-containing protein
MFTSLRARLVALVFLATIPSLILIGYFTSLERRAAGAAAKADALRLAQLAAQSHARIIYGARELLATVAELKEVRSGDAAAGTAVLQKLLPNYRFYGNLGIATPDGMVLSSAIPLKGPVMVGDRPWFKQAVTTREFSVGEYQIGRITERPAVNFASPILDADGKVQAVAFISLDLSKLGRQLVPVDIPEGSQLVIVDRQGVVLVAQPPAGNLLGKPAPEASVLQSVKGYRGEGTQQASAPDGSLWLYAFSPIGTKRGADAYACVGIPAELAYAGANRDLQSHLLALALAAVLAMFAAWRLGDVLVLRRVNALSRAAQQVKAGAFHARTGLPNDGSELGNLAHVFDEMTAALELRDAELKRAANALRAANEELDQHVQQRTAELSSQRVLLQSLIEHIPDYIYVKDLEGRYIVDNPAHRGLLGVRRPEDVTGKTVFDFYPRELAEEFTADDKTVLAAQVPLINRSEFVTDHRGQKIPVLTSKVPWRDKDNKIIGLVCIGRNTGEQAGPAK